MALFPSLDLPLHVITSHFVLSSLQPNIFSEEPLISPLYCIVLCSTLLCSIAFVPAATHLVPSAFPPLRHPPASVSRLLLRKAKPSAADASDPLNRLRLG